MNTAYSRQSFFDRFRDHLPAILYKKVPLPAFLETPIELPSLFPKTPDYLSRKKKILQKKPSAAAEKRNTLEGVLTRGQNYPYAINQTDLEFNAGTWIIGDLECGALARARGALRHDRFIVSQIIFLKPKSG